MTKSNNTLSEKSTKEIISEIFSYLKKQLKALYIFTWSPRGIMLFIGILIITVGANLQKDLIDYILIVPILSKFTFTGFVAQVIFSISAVVILIGQLVLIKNIYRPSFGESYFWLIFIGGYTISRFELFEATKWNFISLWSLEEVYVLDILYISLLLPVFLVLYTSVGCIPRLIRKILYWRGYQSPTLPTFFTEDIPIGNGKNTVISPTYKTLGENLANKLTTQVFEEAFSVGIIGPWGSGKSSFIYHVLKEAQGNRCGAKKIEVVRFYPAFNHSPEQIINDFFTTLIDSLKKYDGRLKSTLLSYSLKLVEAAVNKKKDFQTILSPDNYLMRKRPVYQLYKDLSDIIEKLPVKPIIVIDDIDRLKAEEILEVLRIIRNTANFPNTVFIVAFDKEFIVQSLEDENSSYSRNYIEKYFQMEMYLPQNKKYELKGNFLKMLETCIANNGNNKDCSHIISDIKKFIVNDENATINAFLTNNREVIKLFNQFVHNIDLLKWDKEIDYIDLLYFTILKSRYSSVIYYLYNNWNKFFESTDGRWIYSYNIISVKDDGADVSKNKLEAFLFEFYLDFNIPKSNITKLVNLIEELFEPFPLANDQYEQQKRNKKIGSRGGLSRRMMSVNRTEIFFNLLLSKYELPLTQFSESLQVANVSDFIDFVEKHSDNKVNIKVLDEVNRQISRLKPADIKGLGVIQNAVACHWVLNQKSKEVCDLICDLSDAAYFKEQGFINELNEYVPFIIERIVPSLGSDLNVIFHLWNIIKDDSDSTAITWKWGGTDLESYRSLRMDMVNKAIDAIKHATYEDNYLAELYRRIESNDIRTKDVLLTLLEFYIENASSERFNISEFLDKLDVELLKDFNVIKESKELFVILCAEIFLKDSLSITSRLDWFDTTFKGCEKSDYKYDRLGVTSQQEVLNIRKVIVLEFLQQPNANSEATLELGLSQLSLQYDEKLDAEYRLFLLKDAENLKLFIDRSVLLESRSTYTINRNINDVFRGEQNFIDFLNDSPYSKDPFVLEFIKFHDIDEMLHYNFEPKYQAIFDFKHIEPLKSRKSPSIGLSWAEFRIFKVLDTVSISNVIDTHKNDLSAFSLDKKYFLFNDITTRLWYELIDKYNITKGIKEFGTPGGGHISQNDNKTVVDYGDLNYVDEKLYLGETIIAEEYYYCKYKR